MKNKIIKGHIFAITTVVAWDFTYIVGKFLLTDLSPSQILIFRFVLVAFLAAIINIKEYHKKTIKQELAFVLAGFLIFSYFIIENNALKLTNASNIGFILGTLPFFSSLVAHFFTKDEKITINMIVGFIISLVGIGIISFSKQASLHIKGDILMLCAVVIWSFYSLVLKKSNFKYSSFYVTKKTFGYASIFLIIYMIITKNTLPDISNMSTQMILGIVYLVIIASFLGFIFWAKAIKNIGIVKTSNYLLFSSVNILIFSYFLLNEEITIRKIIGGAFVLFGGFVLRRKNNSTNDSTDNEIIK